MKEVITSPKQSRNAIHRDGGAGEARGPYHPNILGFAEKINARLVFDLCGPGCAQPGLACVLLHIRLSPRR